MLTTHYLDEAERLADRVAILTGGDIRAIGTPRELTRLTAAATSISFTGSVAVEELSGDVLRHHQVTTCGDRVEVRTTEPSTALRALLVHFGDLPDLVVAPPTLEDAYLELVVREEASVR